jgi:hypothetical protein
MKMYIKTDNAKETDEKTTVKRITKITMGDRTD